jgi:hypothetical protein
MRWVLVIGFVVLVGGMWSGNRAKNMSAPVGVERGYVVVGGERGGVLVAEAETTLREYMEFVRYVESTGDHSFCDPREGPMKDHRPRGVRWEFLSNVDGPVVGIDWYDATAYASWSGGRLPTVEEWLAAASGARGVRCFCESVTEWCRQTGPGAQAPAIGGNWYLDETAAYTITQRPRLFVHSTLGMRCARELGEPGARRIAPLVLPAALRGREGRDE